MNSTRPSETIPSATGRGVYACRTVREVEDHLRDLTSRIQAISDHNSMFVCALRVDQDRLLARRKYLLKQEGTP